MPFASSSIVRSPGCKRKSRARSKAAAGAGEVETRSSGKLHENSISQPPRWLNSGRDNGSVSDRDQQFAKIRDNLDLERWFRLPKSHERRIHGHRHMGVRIVQEGPTAVHALDAHASHPQPFTVDDLLPYRAARPPTSQTEAVNRRKIMRKARSQKNRAVLLAELEHRNRESPAF